MNIEKTNQEKNGNPIPRNFEFTVYLNNHIIIQRLFNVIGLNKKRINSPEFNAAVDYNQEVMINYLNNIYIVFLTLIS